MKFLVVVHHHQLWRDNLSPNTFWWRSSLCGTAQLKPSTLSQPAPDSTSQQWAPAGVLADHGYPRRTQPRRRRTKQKPYRSSSSIFGVFIDDRQVITWFCIWLSNFQHIHKTMCTHFCRLSFKKKLFFLKMIHLSFPFILILVAGSCDWWKNVWEDWSSFQDKQHKNFRL